MKYNKLVVLVLVVALGLALVANQYSIVSIQASDDTEEVKSNKSYYSSYTPHDPIWIQSDQEFADQALAESWAGNGTKDFPYIITGYYFNQETQPLRIWDTDVHWIFIDNVVDAVGTNIQCGTWIDNANNGAIVECEFLNRHSGMIVVNVENMTISDNYVHDAFLNGIDVAEMINCDITNNIVEDINNHGILVQGMTDGEISGNVITDCGARGISVTTGFYNSKMKMNLVTDVGSNGIYVGMATTSCISFNEIIGAEDVGIEGMGVNSCTLRNNSISNITGTGISVDYCQASDISMNDIQFCTELGIEVLGGSNTTLYWNTITECENYAMLLNDETEFFEIKFNTFYGNGIDCQLYDDGDTNYFGYNYYSDWLTPDANSDSYVDLPYEIDGAAENSDEWPATTVGYFPAVIESASISTTTTTGPGSPDMTMTLVMIGGAMGAIILVAGIIVLKRR
ncbi:MAG: right-handed parallel beta-helix repeat-containing protein [Candidatus Thorarchaeota archaeon]|nr:MAG: right-handed parallel beta-helix repeat-containing protein [Candidatus Thorarchaeota archaeon]